MYKLLIVDDEERARSGIRKLIDWPANGIEIVGEARDGQEALEIMEGCRADILLTDIRMPVMDGLELIEKVREAYPETKCVIMSGHDEFAYAQRAMAAGAGHYLLKPSRRQEILELVLKLTEEIAAERAETERLEELKLGFRESFPFLKENALGRLALSDHPPYERLLANLKLSGISFPLPYFGTLVLQIDNFHAIQLQYGSVDVELFKYALKNIAEETFAPLCRCAAFDANDELSLILNAEEWLGAQEIEPYAKKIQQNAERYLKFTVSIGIGSMERGIGHLPLSRREAAKALNARFFAGDGKIADYADAAEEEDAAQSSYPLAEERTVLQAVAAGEPDAIRSGVRAFAAALKPETASRENVVNSIFALYFALYRHCVERNVNVQEVFGHQLTEITRMLSRSGPESIVDSLTETALRIGEHLNAMKNANKLFDSVLAYIRDHFRKDINRESVAREAFVTPGYISYLFKQHMQTSFIDYLHRTRIEFAAERLKDHSLRIADIAHEAGYQDEKYFFQVFKKHMGMTPSQYRNNL